MLRRKPQHHATTVATSDGKLLVGTRCGKRLVASRHISHARMVRRVALLGLKTTGPAPVVRVFEPALNMRAWFQVMYTYMHMHVCRCLEGTIQIESWYYLKYVEDITVEFYSAARNSILV